MTKACQINGQSYVEVERYFVARPLFDFVNLQVLPGLTLSQHHFWRGAIAIFEQFTEKNQQLLDVRDNLQQQIDQWHKSQNIAATPFDLVSYQQFLTDIGYLVAEPADFIINPTAVDTEIAELAGPQLVVPLLNARYALNAANARWGSLYDAFYGTDALLPLTSSANGYDAQRGQQVIDYAKTWLDRILPLAAGSHQQAIHYSVVNHQCQIKLTNGQITTLLEPATFCGVQGDLAQPKVLLFVHHGLHLELHFNRHHPIGQQDSAGICDIMLESALTTIQDCEDSVAAVDCADKIQLYRNWLGLMQGTLSEPLTKQGKNFTRSLHGDRHYQNPQGADFSLAGRSLQFIRNVGLLMCSDAILTPAQQAVPEGILDAIITSLIALHDVQAEHQSKAIVNSKKRNIYIVKPKLHGPDEVRFSCELFTAVEALLGLPDHSIKIGIMDEERRTSLNLKACIFEARTRIVFINTGFLDRTGDEIHTSMHAGAMVAKAQMAQQPWLNAYELQNVALGIKCGFIGKAQIGKGMWATPDHMADMLQQKIVQPSAGASCAWVPSPTAATLHALHYHQLSVVERQRQLKQQLLTADFAQYKRELLAIPLLIQADVRSLSSNSIQRELDNNVQGILGYVVRWVEQGIGCSKVPDIDNIARMEDRATLRIASQHIANWLTHGLITKAQVMASLARMAQVVDQQNAQDLSYRAMADNLDNNLAFQAACQLIFDGLAQTNGYTEPLLHQHRQAAKALL